MQLKPLYCTAWVMQWSQKELNFNVFEKPRVSRNLGCSKSEIWTDFWKNVQNCCSNVTFTYTKMQLIFGVLDYQKETARFNYDKQMIRNLFLASSTWFQIKTRRFFSSTIFNFYLQNFALRNATFSWTPKRSFCKITVFAKIYQISPCESKVCAFRLQNKAEKYINKLGRLEPSAGFWKFVNLRVLLCRNVAFFRTYFFKNERRRPVNLGVSFLSFLRFHCFKIRKSRIFAEKIFFDLG